MNFTADYISLCKNKKVQGLRKELEHGDWVFYGKPLLFLDDGFTQVTSPRVKFEDKKVIWLPTGDQLDQCIVDICESREDLKGNNIYYYVFNYDKDLKEYQAYIADGADSDNFLFDDNNPLIAKIKLLISLLKEE